VVDIQSATTAIRRGKKKDRRKKKETTGQKCNGLPYLHYGEVLMGVFSMLRQYVLVAY